MESSLKITPPNPRLQMERLEVLLAPEELDVGRRNLAAELFGLLLQLLLHGVEILVAQVPARGAGLGGGATPGAAGEVEATAAALLVERAGRSLQLLRGVERLVAGPALGGCVTSGEVEAAGAPLGVQLVGHQLPVGERDDVAVLVLGDGEQAIHVLYRLRIHPDRGRHPGVPGAGEVLLAHVAAHRGEALEDAPYDLAVPGGEQVC
jgi:hypothetical protein